MSKEAEEVEDNEEEPYSGNPFFNFLKLFRRHRKGWSDVKLAVEAARRWREMPQSERRQFATLCNQNAKIPKIKAARPRSKVWCPFDENERPLFQNRALLCPIIKKTSKKYRATERIKKAKRTDGFRKDDPKDKGKNKGGKNKGGKNNKGCKDKGCKKRRKSSYDDDQSETDSDSHSSIQEKYSRPRKLSFPNTCPRPKKRVVNPCMKEKAASLVGRGKGRPKKSKRMDDTDDDSKDDDETTESKDDDDSDNKQCNLRGSKKRNDDDDDSSKQGDEDDEEDHGGPGDDSDTKTAMIDEDELEEIELDDEAAPVKVPAAPLKKTWNRMMWDFMRSKGDTRPNLNLGGGGGGAQPAEASPVDYEAKSRKRKRPPSSESNDSRHSYSCDGAQDDDDRTGASFDSSSMSSEVAKSRAAAMRNKIMKMSYSTDVSVCSDCNEDFDRAERINKRRARNSRLRYRDNMI